MELTSYYTVLYYFACVYSLESVMDDSLYALNWKDPVVALPTDRDSMMITTNNNEKYQCYLPKIVKNDKKINEDETGNVPLELELLQPLIYSHMCFYKIEMYWTYEICHGKSLRQFHDEDKTLQQYYLGYYSKEQLNTDLSRAQADRQVDKGNKKIKKTKVFGLELPFFSITYERGTICDLTGNPRTTNVMYVCHEDGGGELYDIKETSSCEYEAVILTKDLCKHPDYGNKKDNVKAIDCHPMDRSPSRPISFQQILHENMQERMHTTKTKIVDSLWGMVYNLADEEDEAEIQKLHSKIVEHKEVREKHSTSADKQASSQHTPTPQTATKPPPQSTLPNQAYDVIIDSFLKGTQCLIGGTGWWKYEICYQQTVKQFHMAKEERQDILLGAWSMDGHLKWTQTTTMKVKHEKGRKYVYHHYTNGDYCEEIKALRSVSVRFECIEGSTAQRGIVIYLVEPSTCKYELVVQSAMFCHIIDLADDNGLINAHKL